MTLDPPNGTGASPGHPPGFDAARYWHFLEDWEVSDEDKSEFLRIMWALMNGFVDLGFGVDSVSLLLRQWAESASEDRADMVSSDHNPQENKE